MVEVQVAVKDSPTVMVEAEALMSTVGAVGSGVTVIVTGADVPCVPRLLVAVARYVYVPAARDERALLYGADVSVPIEISFSKNST